MPKKIQLTPSPIPRKILSNQKVKDDSSQMHPPRLQPPPPTPFNRFMYLLEATFENTLMASTLRLKTFNHLCLQPLPTGLQRHIVFARPAISNRDEWSFTTSHKSKGEKGRETFTPTYWYITKQSLQLLEKHHNVGFWINRQDKKKNYPEATKRTHHRGIHLLSWPFSPFDLNIATTY